MTEPNEGSAVRDEQTDERERRYDPASIEPKWQRFWDEDQTFLTPVDDDARPKAYILDMFPYPSGSGLHVGHPEGYTATDIIARAKRAQGFAVLHPMGWDAFGLPAEQHAVRTGTHPAATTAANIATFKRQLKELGFSYDWTREVNTTDPDYVKWTQWIFLELYARGLAEQSEVAVNWCPALGTVLANEEVTDGLSEVGGHPVERRPLRQWVLKITQYADKLLDGLAELDWPGSTRTMQSEWIGRSEGAEVRFAVKGAPETFVEVFTTRPDTLFGATFMVLAPEHPLVTQLTSDAQREAVDAYVAAARNKSDRDRMQSKDKSGVFTGGFALNPVNGAEVPVYIADYVLYGYGTGAIMAVPAHDERDFEFAQAHGIAIIEVVSPTGEPASEPLTSAMTEHGKAVNSGAYDGLETAEFKRRIIADLEAKGQGKGRVEYKLRDWIFSRQRYWGEPIPVYFPVDVAEGEDPRTGAPCTVRYDQPIPVDRSELPLRLPDLEDYRPGDDPQGVLTRALDWRFFQRDGKWFARETNTMPQWAGSCWYFLRFVDPHNAEAPFSQEAAKRWLPVDLYVGGAEHAVLHLLYSRFWHKVLFDSGVVPVPEPFTKLVHQGMILGEVEYSAFRLGEGDDGAFVSASEVRKGTDPGTFVRGSDSALVSEHKVAFEDLKKGKGGSFVFAAQPEISVNARAHKMSKSRGNVVNPDVITKEYGADSMRLYEMFMGPLEAVKPWNSASIGGVRRFLDRFFNCVLRATEASGAAVSASDETERLLHQTIKKVTEDIDGLRFNTAISQMMVMVNDLVAYEVPPRATLETLTVLLHPFAPHIAEEAWELLGKTGSVQRAAWPKHDEARLVADSVVMPVQINGKVRARVTMPAEVSEPDALALAKADEAIAGQLEGKTLRKVVFVPGKILNLIVG
ncbi:MAG: leucine--tRNA ligase [Polyangiales bacterium]